MSVQGLLGVLCLTAVLQAAPIDLTVHYDSLENGLKILVVRDTNVAVVSCRLYYFVGSMYEGPGATGLSHMYEHMMFKGTRTLGTTDYKKEEPFIERLDSLQTRIETLREQERTPSDSTIASLSKQISSTLEKQRAFIKKDEIWELYQNNGGTNLNAWTGDDMTAYIVTLPRNKVDLFYWIESDRMRDPVLREFPSERDVVMEERRMRYDNRPISRYFERLNALFYIAHPYRNPTIGWASDIQSFTRARLEAHVKQYYTPDNALIVLVGNIDPQKAVRDVDKYFSHIPRANPPKQEVVTREPAPVGQTRFVMTEDAEPRIDMMFHIPGYPSDDLFKLDVVEGILNGRSGRLYQRLVEKEQLCTDAGASSSFRLHNGEFQVWATLKNSSDPAKVEKLIIDEMAKLGAKPPSPAEMERNKNNIRMGFVSGLQSLEGISDRLAWFQRLDSWKDMFLYPDRIAAVDAQSIPAVVTKYLDPTVMTIGILKSKSPQSDNKAAGKKP